MKGSNKSTLKWYISVIIIGCFLAGLTNFLIGEVVIGFLLMTIVATALRLAAKTTA